MLKKLEGNLDAAASIFGAKLNELPLRLYYQNETRFGRINTIQRCWCVKGIAPTVTQQQIREYTYPCTAVCPDTGKTCSIVMPAANTEAMDVFLKTLSIQQNDERIILCMEIGVAHHKTVTNTRKYSYLILPPYSPELNPVELIWRELRGKYFNNKTFQSLDEVDRYLIFAINYYSKDLNRIKHLTKIFYLILLIALYYE